MSSNTLLENEFVLIEEWVPMKNGNGKTIKLAGRVINHSNRYRGEWVVTTKIVKINRKEKYLVTQSGTRYRLGKIHPYYKKDYPKEKRKIFKGF